MLMIWVQWALLAFWTLGCAVMVHGSRDFKKTQRLQRQLMREVHAEYITILERSARAAGIRKEGE